jgi:hypothetical protein
MMQFFGGLFLLYVFCILYAIMRNTKRSADLLAQILLVQTKTLKEPVLDPISINSAAGSGVSNPAWNGWRPGTAWSGVYWKIIRRS